MSALDRIHGCFGARKLSAAGTIKNQKPMKAAVYRIKVIRGATA
jgi:hypothetical protein